MPFTIEFSDISRKYDQFAVIQKSAAQYLITMLDIQGKEDILDVGCGPGVITRQLSELTIGKVSGIDPSSGMIEVAKQENKPYDIEFRTGTAEELNDVDQWDVIFCNSSFQWFKDPVQAVHHFYHALKPGGRVGIQAPATTCYCPCFLRAIERVKADAYCSSFFAYWKSPWFFLNQAEEYEELFKQAGFRIQFSNIEKSQTEPTPADCFNQFSTGAIAGYLNTEYYDIPLSTEYISRFKEIVQDSFHSEVGSDGKVDLVFNRIYLIAEK
jgi:trans-aconitate 2-methyltransferase